MRHVHRKGVRAGRGGVSELRSRVRTGHCTASEDYVDDQASYASNEIAINWQAALVFVAGRHAALMKSSGGCSRGNQWKGPAETTD